MQILQGPGDLAGARGWLWRVDRIERAGTRATIASLVRAGDEGARVLTAVRPAEPMSTVGAPGAMRPVALPAALAAVRRARALERRAFGITAAGKLAGDIHAWQFAAALAFARGHARVLLADPVGMGKTVSSALALAECLGEAPDRRCLVIAPGHLLGQWRAELLRRVAMRAEIADAASLRRLERGLPAGMPAWARPGCLIASIDFVKQPHVVRALEPLAWDMLVIDEAHTACGQSERHAACEMLARRARRLLLVTATPSDGGAERLAALSRMGAAGDPLVRLRHELHGARPLRDRVLPVRPASSAAALHRALSAYAAWIADGPRGDPGITLVGPLLTKRALSSAHAARISLARRAALLSGGSPAAHQPSLLDLCEVEDTEDADASVIGARSGRSDDDERRRLLALTRLAARAARHDRRLAALERLVLRAREPVAIFTCFRDTALLIARRLAPRVDTRVVHGALPPAAASEAIAAFTSGAARVLVATDVASQGLNLHARCRWVIHYDLPWRPSTLRQRTGRVDRLGQARRPHATLLVDRTPLARALAARTAALDTRMREDEFVTPRRWRVLAHADAGRAIARRVEGRAGAAPLFPVTIVQISLASSSGSVVERSLHALGAGNAEAAAWGASEAVRAERRLRLALRGRALRRVARERVVAAALLERLASTGVQRGLFDRRVDRRQAAQGHERRQAALERRARVARHLAQARVTAARVEVVAMFHTDAPRR